MSLSNYPIMKFIKLLHLKGKIIGKEYDNLGLKYLPMLRQEIEILEQNMVKEDKKVSKMTTDDVKVEIKKETHDKLDSLRHMGHNFDDICCALIRDGEEVQKYIQKYINGANGKCITKTILGHAVIANHHFDSNNICKKCGIQTPKIME